MPSIYPDLHDQRFLLSLEERSAVDTVDGDDDAVACVGAAVAARNLVGAERRSVDT